MINLPFKGKFVVTQVRSTSHPAFDLVGLDKNTNGETLVYSICNGTVIDTPDKGTTSYGKYVRVRDNTDGRIFYYAHLKQQLVTKNQQVTRNTVIGYMGSTGNSSGPHLHLELRDKNDSNAYSQNLQDYTGLINVVKGGTYNATNFQKLEMKYKTHCQNYDWMAEKSNGEMAGAYGEGLRIEAVIINADINIQYRVHMEGIGWGPWVPNGCMAGTTGESRRVEAIEIQSSSAPMVGQGYVENIGYQNEVSGTQIVIGTTGQGLRLEGFRLKFA